MVKVIKGLILFNFFIGMSSFGQNVLKENSWVIMGAKKNIYFEQGIFRFNSSATETAAQLQNIRSRYDKKTKQERIVLDFAGTSMIGLYGSILPGKKKITVDLMQVEKSAQLPQTIKGKYLQSVDMYIIEPKLMTLELNFDAVYSFEIFYLLNPLRLVIDVKK